MGSFVKFLAKMISANAKQSRDIGRCRFCAATLGPFGTSDACVRCIKSGAEQKLMARASQKRHRKRWRNLYIVMCGGYAHTR